MSLSSELSVLLWGISVSPASSLVDVVGSETEDNSAKFSLVDEVTVSALDSMTSLSDD